jgi:hypothetical protein
MPATVGLAVVTEVGSDVVAVVARGAASVAVALPPDGVGDGPIPRGVATGVTVAVAKLDRWSVGVGAVAVAESDGPRGGGGGAQPPSSPASNASILRREYGAAMLPPLSETALASS